jgi:hypothetical protein
LWISKGIYHWSKLVEKFFFFEIISKNKKV